MCLEINFQKNAALEQMFIKFQSPAFQRVESAIHWKNHYPADKCYRNQVGYPVVIHPMDSAIHPLSNWRQDCSNHSLQLTLRFTLQFQNLTDLSSRKGCPGLPTFLQDFARGEHHNL